MAARRLAPAETQTPMGAHVQGGKTGQVGVDMQLLELHLCGCFVKKCVRTAVVAEQQELIRNTPVSWGGTVGAEAFTHFPIIPLSAPDSQQYE